MINLGLDDKVAIVTGGAQGLGKATALALGKEGVKVVVADINFESAKATAKQLKKFSPNSMAIKVDVAKTKDLQKLVETVISKLIRIDILVNNAGICPRTPFEKINEQEWDKVLEVNLKSVFFLSQKVFSYMKKRKYGKIISIASSAGKIGGVQVGAHYSASKAGVISLTKSLALEGAPFGINVNAVCPGVIGTQMTYVLSKESLERYKKLIPLGKIGSSDDVANAVLFLASDYSGYITGEIMDVNGGFIMD